MKLFVTVNYVYTMEQLRAYNYCVQLLCAITLYNYSIIADGPLNGKFWAGLQENYRRERRAKIIAHSSWTVLSGAGAHGECATFDVWVEANGPECIELHKKLDRFVEPSNLLQ